ncbi:Hypothetical predicted protein [Mytilus galloprovincialis]|uniref:Uncharacterized protein n=1 Tax=Mytilus galloprovincialis TaxID=29158 RepID=A0A8B6D4X8_MYTGA|nr:Hypothetical predicted protein [Mytilus galloprovincialis]
MEAFGNQHQTCGNGLQLSLEGQPDNGHNREDCVEANIDGWNNQDSICGKRTVLNRACQEEVTDDKIYYRGGSERNHGGGICVFPEKCINCHDGFYANGGYCANCVLFIIQHQIKVDVADREDVSSIALCNGKPTPHGGCAEVNPTDTIYYRGGGSRNQGGGTCISPGVCADCQDGFHADEAQCTICPWIANCNHRRCSNAEDNYCEWCQYEIVDKQYWRAYTRHKDGHMKECRSKL